MIGLIGFWSFLLALLAAGLLWVDQSRQTLIDRLGGFCTYVTGGVPAVLEKSADTIKEWIGNAAWALVWISIMLVYGIAFQDRTVVTATLVFTALMLLIIRLLAKGLLRIVKIPGEEQETTIKRTEALVRPLATIAMWLFFINFLALVKPEWFAGSWEKIAVLVAALLFFAALAAYLGTRGRIPARIMTGIVVILLLSYFAGLQWPNLNRGLGRLKEAIENQIATLLDRESIRTETDAGMTIGILTENTALYRWLEMKGSKIVKDVGRRKKGTKVAVYNHQQSPVKLGAEMMIEVVIANPNGDFVAGAEKAWVPVRKVKLESPLSKEKKALRTVSRPRGVRRFTAIFQLPVGKVINQDKKGQRLSYQQRERIQLEQLTSPPQKLTFVNHDIPSWTRCQRICTSGPAAKDGWVELMASGDKEITVRVRIIPHRRI